MVLPSPRREPSRTPAQLAPLERRALSAKPLPAPLTCFIGRELEVATVIARIRDPTVRLTTLTGSGGVGKTRLALHAVEAVIHDYADGQVFVPLAATADPALVAPAIAQSLGIRETKNVPTIDRLFEVLRDRQLLLILDNLEHIIEAAPVVVSLLVSCPELRVLATSRSPLRVSGEHVVRILPLAFPTDDAQVTATGIMETDAVQLFFARARAVRHDFTISDENAATVAEIVRRVEGLPLAIELAAARLAHLPPEALLARLEPRLPLLTGGERDLPERQQTMEATIAWSYELLTPEQQRLFRHLAVFPGGFTIEAACALMDRAGSTDIEVLDGVASLVAMCLVHQDVDAPGAPRYIFLEMVREYGLNLLIESGEYDHVSTRHAKWFLEFAERADPAIWGGPEHALWLDRLEIELPNLRAALNWLDTSADGASLLRLAAALGGLWIFRSFRIEGRDWLTKALAYRDETVPAAHAMALLKLAVLDRSLGSTDVEDLVLESLAIRRRLDDQRPIARSLIMLGGVRLDQGSENRAIAVLQEAQEILERLNEPVGLGHIKSTHAKIALRHGNVHETLQLLQEAYEFYERDGFVIGMARVSLSKGWIQADHDNVHEAALHFAESLRLWSEFRNIEFLVDAMTASAYLGANMGKSDAASRLFGFANTLSEKLGYFISSPKRERLEQGRLVAVEALGDEAFASNWQTGRILSIPQAIDEACEMLSGITDERSTESASHRLIESNSALHAGLSPREREVLSHVAAGRSNRQIASLLHVSDRTVENHVHHILAKLDLPSRAAATAYAIHHGLA